MIEAEGIVVRTENSIAFVETRRQSGCGGCSSNGACGMASLSGLGAKSRLFEVQNPVGAIAGDSVVIGLEEKSLLKGSLTLYVLPLLLLILGALVASFLAPSLNEKDGYSVLGAALGLAAGGAGLRLAAARIGANSGYRPIILRKQFSRKIVCFSED